MRCWQVLEVEGGVSSLAAFDQKGRARKGRGALGPRVSRAGGVRLSHCMCVRRRERERGRVGEQESAREREGEGARRRRRAEREVISQQQEEKKKTSVMMG